MRLILMIVGVFALLAGILFALQGSGVVNWPSDSFMLGQAAWRTNGIIIAIAGAAVIMIARRVGSKPVLTLPRARVSPRQACRAMVGLLALAHDRSCEAELATALETTLAAGEVPDLAALRERFGPAAAPPPAVSVALPAIATYDALLGAEPVGAAP